MAVNNVPTHQKPNNQPTEPGVNNVPTQLSTMSWNHTPPGAPPGAQNAALTCGFT